MFTVVSEVLQQSDDLDHKLEEHGCKLVDQDVQRH
jgi:hypothetical protein